MNTIDQCPRCTKYFVRHLTDWDFARPIPWDKNKSSVSFEYICQECKEKNKKQMIW